MDGTAAAECSTNHHVVSSNSPAGGVEAKWTNIADRNKVIFKPLLLLPESTLILATELPSTRAVGHWH